MPKLKNFQLQYSTGSDFLRFFTAFFQIKILIRRPGFEAPFGENSRFTQLFKVRYCVTIECRPPQRKRLQRSQSTHRINLVYHEHPQTVKKVGTCFLLEYSKEITALDSGR